MAKPAPKKKSSLPLLIAGLVIVLIIGLTGGGTPPKSTKKGGIGTMPMGAKKATDSLITPEDYNVKFASVDTEFSNAFKPAVVRLDPNRSTSALVSNGIPPLFAGGEAAWIYTGNMTVDGKANALIENTQTGEGVFLKPGEHWKALTLKEVRETSIVLDGPNGLVKTISYNITEPSEPAIVAPLNPGAQPRLAGNIGNGQIMADANNFSSLPAVGAPGTDGTDQQSGRSRRRQQQLQQQ